jgi:hypothetical protein
MKQSVTVLKERSSKRGPVCLLLVEYRDGRISYHVSLPGGVTMFGTDHAWARRYYSAVE